MSGFDGPPRPISTREGYPCDGGSTAAEGAPRGLTGRAPPSSTVRQPLLPAFDFERRDCRSGRGLSAPSAPERKRRPIRPALAAGALRRCAAATPRSGGAGARDQLDDRGMALASPRSARAGAFARPHVASMSRGLGPPLGFRITFVGTARRANSWCSATNGGRIPVCCRCSGMKLARPLIVAVLTLAVVVSLPVAVAATNGTGLQQETAATAAAQDPAAVEASLGLDRPSRRLIQQGLRNEGVDPGTPDGLFGPRTRAAIQDWQQSRGASPTGCGLERVLAPFLPDLPSTASLPRAVRPSSPPFGHRGLLPRAATAKRAKPQAGLLEPPSQEL